MIISSAGAEGISLSCVRQVHILEPFWNYVRIDQVLGRAIRMKSHLNLPKEDRNVEQYLYLSILPQGTNLETVYKSLKNDPNQTWLIPDFSEESVKPELSKSENNILPSMPHNFGANIDILTASQNHHCSFCFSVSGAYKTVSVCSCKPFNILASSKTPP